GGTSRTLPTDGTPPGPPAACRNRHTSPSPPYPSPPYRSSVGQRASSIGLSLPAQPVDLVQQFRHDVQTPARQVLPLVTLGHPLVPVLTNLGDAVVHVHPLPTGPRPGLLP